MSSSRGERKTVTIDEEYLAFLHDALSENIAKLKEILGESAAQMIYSVSADRLVKTTGGAGESGRSLGSMISKIESWGMKVRRKDLGDLISIEVGCPYAEKVHPTMASDSPKCPLGEYLLGAARAEDPGSLLQTNDLASDGVSFVIKKGKKG